MTRAQKVEKDKTDAEKALADANAKKAEAIKIKELEEKLANKEAKIAEVLAYIKSLKLPDENNNNKDAK